jgi:heat shock protein HslJ
MGRRGSIVAVLAAMVVMIGGADQTSGLARAERSTHGPFDRSYVIVSVRPSSGRSPMRKSNAVGITFKRLAGDNTVWIFAGCNVLIARLKIGPHRLWVGRIGGQPIKCSPAIERDDDWLRRFFQSDPRWRAHDGRLILKTGFGQIVLRPQDAAAEPV